MSNTEKKSEHGEQPEELAESRKEFLQMFKRGAVFTEELLKENERLRYRNAELEARAGLQSSGSDSALVKELLDKVQRLLVPEIGLSFWGQ